MYCSLVTTTFNERECLEDTINDIENQSVKPNEIVIVDAGSTDGTIERLQVWKEESKLSIKLIISKGCNVAKGRNLAIKNTNFNLIASTDFGCRYNKDWLKSIIEPFNDPKIEVVGGAFTINKTEVKTLAAKADYILSNGYTYTLESIKAASSRSIAYYKYVWEKIGGYEEWLTLAGDDSTFWYLIEKYKFNFKFINLPYVIWGRHKSFKNYRKESFRYGIGSGESRTNLRSYLSSTLEIILRYSIPVSIFIFMNSLISTSAFIFLGLIQLIGFRSYMRAFLSWYKYRSRKYNIIVYIASLYLLEITRISAILGYLKGYFWSRKNIVSNAKKLRKRLN